MEFPEPWRSRDDWDRQEAAFVRGNRLRRHKGLSPSYATNRPNPSLRLEGDGNAARYSAAMAAPKTSDASRTAKGDTSPRSVRLTEAEIAALKQGKKDSLRRMQKLLRQQDSQAEN